MKWFIKVLSHYADFSGRARRTEYWMFVLFNVIFNLVWTFLVIAGVLVFTSDDNNRAMPFIMVSVASLSYYFLMMLPSMSVAVRRLHDLGKSGWMMFVGLIPIAGGIWLLVLMLTEGNKGENEYGPDPKTTEEIFDDRAKLNSAGITLIVASTGALILTIIYQWIVPILSPLPSFTWMNLGSLIPNIFDFAATILLLLAGIYLLTGKGKTIDKIRENKKNPFILLLIAVSIYFILSILHFYVLFSLHVLGWKFSANAFIFTLSYLFVALFAASVLFSPKNKEFIRGAAVLAVVFSGLCLLWKIYFGMNNVMGDMQRYEALYQLRSIFGTFYILLPVAFIVLAGTFLSRSANVVFIREDHESNKV